MKDFVVTEEIVKHVGSLARIEISEDEVSVFKNHMQGFLKNVKELGEVSTDNIRPFFSPAKENISVYTDESTLREDKIREPLKVNELLKNAPKKTANQFRVDAVIKDAE